MKLNCLVLSVTLMLVCWSGQSVAQSAPREATPGAANAANPMILNQRLLASQAELQQSKARIAELEDQLAALEKDYKSVRKSDAQREKLTQKLSDTVGQYKDRYETLLEQAKSLKAMVIEARELNRRAVSEREEMAGKLEQAELARVSSEEALQLQIENNRKLATVTREVLQQYEKKGVWASLLQREPITRLKSAEIKSLVNEYQLKVDELSSQQAGDGEVIQKDNVVQQ